MATNGNGLLPTWKNFAAFQVFGDYAPSQGFRVLVRVGAEPERLIELLQQRAHRHAVLDPDLALANLRAGLGLLRTGLVSFAYATVEETIVLLRPEAVEDAGAPILVQNRLVSDFSAMLSLLLGQPVAVSAQIYEVPDVEIARRGLVALAEDVEEATPRRSALWLGAQLQGRGEPFHPSMAETIEEQSHLLQTHGIDMDALPAWWWRGVAAQPTDAGVQVFDELPSGDELGNLVVG
ncbi:MAG: hypothetical protein H6712_08695 [Myxococcales bacterium]|nr:hypothetical protein [Myxococcales bacterium]MCB9713918.1 hypothetical protein [Myxococcales bacterium]